MTSNATTADGEASATDAPASPAVLNDDALVADCRLLSALGNDTRYELVRLIAAADGDVCVCDLQSTVGVGQSAVSQALSRLRSAGLVTRRKEGNWRYYGTTGAAEALLATLDDLRGGER